MVNSTVDNYKKEKIQINFEWRVFFYHFEPLLAERNL